MFTYIPNRVLLEIGPLTVHWYGLLVVTGFLVGFSVFYYLFKKYQLKTDGAYNLFFYTIIFGLIGARVYYIFYAWSYYSQHPLDILKVWQGGLAIHGAIIAAVVVIYFYSKKKGWSVWLITDLAATALPLSLAIGRWGNYFNQELFGRPTDLPWGIPVAVVSRPAEFINFTHFHPTFLYEFILDLILFGILMFIHFRKFRNQKLEIRNWKSGNITLLFLFGYSLIRFLMEFLRVDYSPVFWGMRWAQLVSLIIMVAVIIFWFIRKKKFLRI